MDKIKNKAKRFFCPHLDKEQAGLQQKLKRVQQFIQQENITNG